MNKNIIIGLLIIGVLGLTACSTPGPVTPETFDELNASQDLKKFGTVEELRSFLAEQSLSDGDTDAYYGRSLNKMTTTGAMPTAMAESAVASDSVGGGASDYSQTNVQVEGVDEADFVKNDNRYIYLISNNKIVIIDAADAEDSEIISETEISSKNDYYGQPQVRELFLNKDKLAVFVDSYERTFYFEKYNIEPIETSRQNTIMYLYDVSDRENPEVIEKYVISGAYFSSRMIGDDVYIVTQEGLYNWRYYDGPMIAYAKTILRPDIYYFDNPEQNYQMNTVTSINLGSEEVVDSESFMLGYGNTLMVSEDNIYIAYQKQQNWCWGWRCTSVTGNERERFMTAVVPNLEGEIEQTIKNIISKDLEEDEEWSEISREFTSFYNKLMDDEELQDEYEKMFEDIEDALSEYDTKKALEQSKTIIHKIAISDGEIEYQTKGEVDGRLLNQFSLDEYDGNLRVATTINYWLNNIGNKQYNNIYMLDKDMDVIGSLERLAENESIYSSRFVGEKLYLVTFRQIDPFFVIDLSNPKEPEVLGYLKIPGYSSYLHPISDTLIIGVGKDVGENEWGGTSAKGIKISLFDVSDFNNPVELSKYGIGVEGSDSPVLHDHRAFMYSDTKNILVIPVTEIVSREKTGMYDYRTSVWHGAYVFKIVDNGFSILGKVKHSSSDTRYYYWFDSTSVTRSLYLDDTLYTISGKYVKANDLSNDLEDIKTLKLPYQEDIYKGYDYETADVTVSAPELEIMSE
ncbi:MAG: beta-propeller domain-containing protein [Candidatus Woesearchaeota archaeon]